MAGKESGINSERISGLMGEYNALIKEKHLRMEHRLKLVSFNILAFGALMTMAFEREKYIILLVVPLTSSLFGLLAAYHSRAVQDIAHHIKSELAPQITAALGEPLPIWDSMPARRDRTWYRVWCFHVPIIASFLMPATLCLVIFYTGESTALNIGEVVLFIVDILLLLCSAIIYVQLIFPGLFGWRGLKPK